MSGPSTTTERRTRFESLVERAEALYQRSPGAYRRRLLGLALLGYGVIFGILLLLIGLIGGSVAAAFASTAFLILLIKKKLIIALAVIAYVLVKAIWVKLERPEGYPLTRATAPALFRELDGMRTALALPAIHQVLLTLDFNAAVVQTPRLGVFGWQHNTVMLGLPLLLAMSAQEARAVLAHELGHLSGNHSRFAGWIYRVRMSWYRIMEAFDGTDGWAASLLRRFFHWYAPHFSAMSFALARSNELDADAISVELTSREATASALVRSATAGRLEGEAFWSPLLERASQEPEPEGRPYTALARFHAGNAPSEGRMQSFMDDSLAQATDHSDTHPALADRLAAIGATPRLPEVPAHSAAEAWLGDRLGQALQEFDAQWLARNGEAWQERYEEVQTQRARLQELAATPREELEPLALWELAWLSEQHRGADVALPLFMDYKRREPEDPDADFVIGRILLERDDARGEAFMKRAQKAFAHSVDACEILYGFWLKNGDPQRAEQWRLTGESAIDRRQLAYAERDAVAPGDTFLDSALDTRAMDALRRALEAVDGVAAAWIARKQLEVLPDESPLYVLAFKPTGLFTRASKLDTLRDTLGEQLEFPGATFIVALAGDGKSLAKKIRKHGNQLM
jgi:Zn-dependent protease with chaperone function